MSDTEPLLRVVVAELPRHVERREAGEVPGHVDAAEVGGDE